MPLAYLQCAEPGCGKKYALDKKGHACDLCGGLLEVGYEFSSVPPDELCRIWRERRMSNAPVDRSGVWRFRELLPFLEPSARIISLCEGSTPVVEVPRAGEWAGGVRLYIKHQGNNPTGSFKDLGMTACITQAVSRSVRAVACASTGNTSASMAAYAARAGMKAFLFVPGKFVSKPKLSQAIDFGAVVVEAGDNFDQSFSLLNTVAEEMGLHIVNSTNPFRIEGQKTIVAELMDQRYWEPPDYIAVPGGNLGNCSAIGKGLRELKELHLIQKVPRLAVIQAAGASPFYRMVAAGAAELVPERNPDTEATAIRIGNPASWKKALRTLELTNGLCHAVTDEEIFEAKSVLATDGIACEPASAASVAGIRKLRQEGKIEPGAEIVAILTGNQLKDTDYILKHHSELEATGRHIKAEPSVDALRKALEPWLSPVTAQAQNRRA